jgi:kynurenine formamidase
MTDTHTNNKPDHGAVSVIMQALEQLEVHDVSPVLEPGMAAFFGHPPLEVDARARNFEEHGYFAQTLTISEHTGAHVDAPGHIHPGASSVDELPADALIRPYKKFDLTPPGAAGEPVGVERLNAAAANAGFTLHQGDVAVFDFGWEEYLERMDEQGRSWWGRNEPGLSDEACRYLAESGVAAVASDTWGCDTSAHDGHADHSPGHNTWFLPRGILIIEGLVGLSAAPATGLFVALPLKIKGGSGSPLRVVLLGEAQGREVTDER